MDLMQMRRNLLMQMQAQPTELYPVGTDIIGMYVGRDPQTGYGLFETGYTLDTDGEYVSGNTAKPINSAYIPIDPTYTYYKNAKRMYVICFYDSSKQLLLRVSAGINTYNNLQEKEITDIPQNAAYLRICAYATSGSNWQLAITRTA